MELKLHNYIDATSTKNRDGDYEYVTNTHDYYLAIDDYLTSLPIFGTHSIEGASMETEVSYSLILSRLDNDSGMMVATYKIQLASQMPY